MGAHSRSLLLLLAAPLVVYAAGGVRAAAGRAAAGSHRSETGGKTGSRRHGTRRRARVSSDADADAARPRRHAFVAARWDKVSDEARAQDYVRDILSPAKRGALGRILILNGRVFANNEGGKVQQHLTMVSRAVRERHSKVKNVAYLHNSEASGSCLQNKKG